MKRLAIVGAILGVSVATASAQVSPKLWKQGFVPSLTDWQAALLWDGKSLSEAMDSLVQQLTDTANDLLAKINAKISAQGGSGDGNTFTNATIQANSLTTPAGTFNEPQSGSNLGVGSQTYLAPNQVIQGSLSIRGDAPIIHLHSFLRPNMFDIWQDGSGAGNISVNDPIFGALNLYAHNVNIGGSSAGAVLDFYGGGSAPAMAMWQGSDGQGFIQTLGYNLNLSAGTGWIYFASPIQMSSGAIISDTTKCGSLSGAKGCISFRDAQGAVSYAPYFQ